MIFGIFTHAIHKIKDGQVYAYEPYVREMNLWAKQVDEIIIVAPVEVSEITAIETAYIHANVKVIPIPNFDITSIQNLCKAMLVIPKICWTIFRVMQQVNHIHLRCPGNIGLLGCLVQMAFPSKSKTAKYAGNWDPNSKQPITYKFQKWLLSTTLLTKNIQVLVYGQWPNQTSNILPFFTASYHESEKETLPEKKLEEPIKFIFVGGLTVGKQPLLSVQVIHQLLKKGKEVELHVYGDGVKRKELESYLEQHQLKKNIFLHGNVGKQEVKKAFQQAQFLIFISKSEGWPKVVAEAMFWSCVPITSKVSCVPFMLGNGTRGAIVNASVKDVVAAIENYLYHKEMYLEHSKNAQKWSREYTLEKFEIEIKKLLHA